MRYGEGWKTATGLAGTAFLFGIVIGVPVAAVLGAGLAFPVAFAAWAVITDHGQRSGAARGTIVGAITGLVVSAAMLPMIALSQHFLGASLPSVWGNFFLLPLAGLLITGWMTGPLGAIVAAMLMLGGESQIDSDAGSPPKV